MRLETRAFFFWESYENHRPGPQGPECTGGVGG